MYCRPLAVVFTPAFFAFSARNFSPSRLFFMPSSFRSFIAFSRCLAKKACLAAAASLAESFGFSPFTMAATPALKASRSIFAPACASDWPTSMPMA